MFGSAYAASTQYNQTFTVNPTGDSSSIQVNALKYSPYPANPGEYFTLWISAQKTGSGTEPVVFQLDPQYPFSLDPNQNATTMISNFGSTGVLLQYKVRVNDSAVQGMNQIGLKYKLANSDAWTEQWFNISVNSAETAFDGVIQDYESGSLSLALANTGQNTANSVIVRIPNQPNFRATGVSGQMVGNLQQGDYTIVSFQAEQTNREAKDITFEVDYTDTLGNRRTVYLTEPVPGSSGNYTINRGNFTRGNFAASGGQGFYPGENQSKSNAWKYAVAIIVIGFFVYLFFKRKYDRKRESLKNEAENKVNKK